MSSNGGPTVAVKLFIDKQKKRVLFAESDKDFVDILFSFLTLPLGTIVRLLGKQSQIGSLDELYKSVESLSIEHFQTESCKTMLLDPVNSAGTYCNRLKVRVDAKKIGLYICSSSECRWFCSVYDGVCKCNGYNFFLECPQNVSVTVGGNDDGVFVKSGPKFIITDDLQVAPASTGCVFSLLDRFGLQHQAKPEIEEKVLELNSNKIIRLLRKALISNQPLTGLCFDVPTSLGSMNRDHLSANLLLKEDNETSRMFSAIKIRLVHIKDNSSVLYAEVGADFVDIC